MTSKMHNYSLVTVCHQPDLPLLKLQARSLKCYLDRSFVKEIIVVDNTKDGELDRKQLTPHYGDLSVRFIKASQICTLPKNSGGWFTQQVLKLMVSRHVKTDRYLILDSKNHLIRKADRSMFEDADGRMLTTFHSYEKHTLKRYLLRACEYFKLNTKLVMDKCIPTTPPFVFDTEIVKKLIDYVERRDKKTFTEVFLSNRLTEFFLYGSYIVSTGHKLDEYYKVSPSICSAMWKEYSNDAMQKVLKDERVFMSVHRRCFKNMDQKTVHLLAKFWHEKHLFVSYENARRFVEGCAKTYSD